MPTPVILPALGMSQNTGKIIQWLKSAGEHVSKGEALAEIETDKATVEIEAPVDGTLAGIAARAGDDVPVGQVIALILAANEAFPIDSTMQTTRPALLPDTTLHPVSVASILAARVAADYNVDLSQVKTSGKRIQKADVLAYLQNLETARGTVTPRLVMASPKARRLASEQGKDLESIKGSGPDGAVLAADVLAASTLRAEGITTVEGVVNAALGETVVSNTWRIMAERTTQSWTSVPHFYLTREVNASRLIQWRETLMHGQNVINSKSGIKRGSSSNGTVASSAKISYTDMLVKIVAAALRVHPRVNASWSEDKITLHPEIHVGLAVALEDGLVVPVIHAADTLRLSQIAQQRAELVAKAQAGKLRLAEISGGTFTISNLGMFNVDAFNAIINQPQAAILAVGRIAERVVPIHGQPAVEPMMVLTLSCDHRVIDGARGARFLESIANSIEAPLGLLT
jgi:pyruvate dehydrogenase E2 component (dihydrolipoamide acetyltransferase)